MDNPQQQRQHAAENAAQQKPEDRIRFGVIPGHPDLNLVTMDPFAEAVEDISRRNPDKESVAWEEVDRELGIGVRYLAILQINDTVFELSEEKLRWLIAMGQGVLKATEIQPDGSQRGTPALEEEMKKFRRHIRGEVAKRRET